ncbi:MAG: 4Fe-4S binding protein, partial [Anaerolineae bacterium]|nr:4Fe-4S binding protein [Anaerolineae bacterium]
MADKFSRKVVQLGLLALFLYPFLPLIYRRLTYRQAPVVLSWLLTWDPLLFLARLPRLGQGALIVGGPLLVVALTFVAGRFFCGWVCPVGTVLDLVRPLFLWRWRRRPRQGRLERVLASPDGNSYLRYALAFVALVLSLLSLKLVGLLDPLVVFHRTATMAFSDWLALRSPGLDLHLAGSLLFVAIIALEAWRPRFWCRHLCPQGALLGWLSRWSLLNRRVSQACHYCGKCRDVCPMGAIPKEPHDTSYQDCHFCLACEAACPQRAISFGFGPLAWARWQARRRERGSTAHEAGKACGFPGGYVPAERTRAERLLGLRVGRRVLAGGVVAGAGTLALWPLLR